MYKLMMAAALVAALGTGCARESQEVASTGTRFAIAVTDANRAKDLPNVPTLREAGVQSLAPVSSWFGLLTAPNTPAPLVARLNAEVNAALKDPEVRSRLEDQSFELRGGTSEALAALMKEEMERNARIVAEAKIKAD